MKFIKYSLVILIGLICALELILRLGYYEQLKTQAYPLIYQKDSLLEYSLIPNCTSRICTPSIDKKFTLNNHGFYGKDFSTSKPDSVMRIAIVGTSITEGIWLNGPEDYPSILQKIVNKNGYKNIEILNCSLGGINKDIRNYNLIRFYVSKYSPDLILFHVAPQFYNENEYREVYHNYLLRHAGTDDSRQYAIDMIENVKKMKFFTGLYDISYIFRAYCKKFYENNICPFSEVIRVYREKTSSAPDITTYKYSLKTTAKLLNELKKELACKRCTLIVFSMGQSKMFKEMFSDEGIPYISLDIRFDKEMVHKHDSHPNQYGQKVIAENFYNKLIENDLLPAK